LVPVLWDTVSCSVVLWCQCCGILCHAVWSFGASVVEEATATVLKLEG
jgi:hypothetical protein